MSRYIDSMFVAKYRGIKNLKLDDLGDINIVVGDNNSGKTSLLEAIRIVCSPHSISDVAFIARQRDAVAYSFFRANSFISLLSALVKDEEEYYLQIEAMLEKQLASIEIEGSIIQSIIEPDDIDFFNNRIREKLMAEEVEVLSGTLKSIYPLNNPEQLNLYSADNRITEFRFHKYSRTTRSRESFFPVEYLSPIHHLAVNSLPPIRSKEFMRDTIDLLQLFDSNIVDLRIDIDDDTNRKTIIVEHKRNGYMPLSAFGDGTKKIVSFAGTIAKLNRGILLIDEYESSIHSKGMKPVFEFLIKACQRKNIQLFVTTHSIEALDKMIECCEDILGDLRVITLEQNSVGSFAQVNNGYISKNLRFDHDAELR